MKHFLYSLILAIMLVFAACEDDLINSFTSSKSLTTITITPPDTTFLDFSMSTTTADSLRLFVMILHNNIVVDYKEVSNWDGQSSISCEFDLMSDTPYTLSAWADYGDTYYDVICDIGHNPEVAMTTTSKSYSNRKEDAYFAIKADVELSSYDDVVALQLERPLALVVINTTDLDTPALVNMGLYFDEYTRDSVTTPTSLNLANGSVSNFESIQTVGFCDGSELAFDYLFVESSSTYDFTYQFMDSTATLSCDFTNIPVHRNYITNISGDLLTSKYAVTITIDQAWSE